MAKTQGSDVSVVLNAIRETASSAYQNTIPLATASNISDVGEAVLSAIPSIRNEFMENLWNKVGMTLVESPVVTNDFEFLKKGRLEYGQTIEDIYVGLAVSEPYITGMSDGDYPDPFAIRKTEHYSAFYSTILSRQYTQTRHLTDLKKAFHNNGGVEQFLSALTNSMVSAENYDDMRMTIALLARQIEEGLKLSLNAEKDFHGVVHLISDFNALYPDEVVTSENAMLSKNFLKYFTNQLKKYSKRMRHLRSDFNVAGVKQVLPQSRQRIIMLEDITVDFETELLAWTFNQGRLEIGGVDTIDTWYSIGADHDTPPVVTPEDIAIKGTFGEDDTIAVAMIYDEDMVKIYNKERIGSDQPNGKGNYWNIFNSVEDIYACSPYKNYVAFLLD